MDRTWAMNVVLVRVLLSATYWVQYYELWTVALYLLQRIGHWRYFKRDDASAGHASKYQCV